MLHRPLGLSLLLALLLPAPTALAAPLEFGAVARGFFTAHGRFGNFYGVESRLVRSGPLFLGASGFGGPVLNAPRSALGYGGLVAGVEVPLPFNVQLAARLWVGGGGGVLDGQTIIAPSLEPSLAIGLPLSDSVTGSFTLGTLRMLGVENLHGLVIGFRADM